MKKLKKRKEKKKSQTINMIKMERDLHESSEWWKGILIRNNRSSKMLVKSFSSTSFIWPLPGGTEHWVGSGWGG